MQVAEIKDVDVVADATEVVPNVTANHDHLAIPNVASMSTPPVWDRLLALIDLYPGEGGHGQDPHILELSLVTIRQQSLATEHVNVVAAAIWSGCNHCAGVDAVVWICASSALLIPGAGRDIVHIDVVHLSLKNVSFRGSAMLMPGHVRM